MRDELFALCRRYADAHVDSSGVAVTPVSGITMVRALHHGDLQAAIARPLVAMLLQGRKSVTTGLASFDYGPGEAMVIAADVPTTSQLTEASCAFPITRWCWSWTWLSCASCRRPGHLVRMRRPASVSNR